MAKSNILSPESFKPILLLYICSGVGIRLIYCQLANEADVEMISAGRNQPTIAGFLGDSAGILALNSNGNER